MTASDIDSIDAALERFCLEYGHRQWYRPNYRTQAEHMNEGALQVVSALLGLPAVRIVAELDSWGKSPRKVTDRAKWAEGAAAMLWLTAKEPVTN